MLHLHSRFWDMWKTLQTAHHEGKEERIASRLPLTVMRELSEARNSQVSVVASTMAVYLHTTGRNILQYRFFTLWALDDQVIGG